MNSHVGYLICVLAATASAQATWTLTSRTGMWPPPRSWLPSSYDLSRGTWLVYAGFTTSLPSTWLFDGRDWTDVSSFPAPDPGGLVYDASRMRHVLFEDSQDSRGGLSTTPFETWEWHGTWQRMTPTASPPPRYFPAMAYDPVNRGVLLHGGIAFGVPGPRNDTWLWDGRDWTQLAPATVPPEFEEPRMTTDWRHARIVMYSSPPPRQGGPAQTWVWDGRDWARVSTSIDPGPRAAFGMTYDWARDRIVVFGGIAPAGCRNDTWEFDGSHWRQRVTVLAPSRRHSFAMGYDPLRRRVMLFGGDCEPAIRVDDQLWFYETPTPASYASHGGGCVGSSGMPMLSAPLWSLPWTGDSLDVGLTNVSASATAFMATGFSDSAWAGLRLPLDLGAYGAPGCLLRAEPFVWFPFAPDASGVLRWTLPIASDPALVGIVFFNQALVLDQAANRLGAVLSNAMRGQVGIR